MMSRDKLKFILDTKIKCKIFLGGLWSKLVVSELEGEGKRMKMNSISSLQSSPQGTLIDPFIVTKLYLEYLVSYFPYLHLFLCKVRFKQSSLVQKL